MKVLVTGGNGQLGSQIREFSAKQPDLDFTFIDIEDLDITNETAVAGYFTNNHFDAIINCAAYTNVDGAEDHIDEADTLNESAVGYLAQAAKDQNCLLVHISTDYVFSGRSYKPYTEDDQPNPASAYGRSKLKGEKMLTKIGGNIAIIRTSWLYSAFGHNFVKTIYRLSFERNELKVVFDQVGNPTYAGDLAEAAIKVVRKQQSKKGVRIYHFSNEGVCSWYDFAEAIVELNGSGCSIIPIRSEEFPQKANRPPFSTLDKSKIKQDIGISIPHWRESLKKVINELKNNHKIT